MRRTDQPILPAEAEPDVPPPTAHLEANRRLVLKHALYAAASSLIPLPFVDELAAQRARRAMCQELAGLHRVGLDAEAADALVTERGLQRSPAGTAGTLVVGLLQRTGRRIAAVVLAARAVDEGVATFRLGTLFDHYAARHHVGASLSPVEAAELRRVILSAHSSLDAVRQAFVGALRAGGRIAALAPGQAWRALGRLVRRRKSDVVDFERGPFRVALDVLDQEMRSVGAAQIARMIEEFEAAFARSELARRRGGAR